DEELGLALRPVRLDRHLELVLGAGRVRGAVRALELLRQAGAQARPDDADHDVGLGRRHDLVLEGGGREQRLVLPEDRRDARPPLRLTARTIASSSVVSVTSTVGWNPFISGEAAGNTSKGGRRRAFR